MIKGKELYRGKAKTVYHCEGDEQHYIMHFRDDASAFDGVKRAQLQRKGLVNNHFNAFIMQALEGAGIKTHFVKLLSQQDSLVRRLKMLPIECVVRNIATGSLTKRLGVEEGLALSPPIFEFFYKDDALHDPMINDSHIVSLGWGTVAQWQAMKTLTLQVNEILKPLFLQAGLLLVDYKLEFGEANGELYLGDEFTPDGCRIWDEKSGEKLDKDRFRQDLGNVIDAYEAVAKRLGMEIPKT